MLDSVSVLDAAVGKVARTLVDAHSRLVVWRFVVGIIDCLIADQYTQFECLNCSIVLAVAQVALYRMICFLVRRLTVRFK